MTFILVVIAFFAGLFMAKKRSAARTTAKKSLPASAAPYVPPRKYRHSRWEERDELFHGMLEEGVYFTGCEWLTSKIEKAYFDKLEKWFGRSCYIHCQVSLGRMINFPEQPGFSEEERKRFFAIYNGMAMDYVLVSRKTGKIVCVIELDDASHNRPDRVQRDNWLNQIMTIARIPFLRVSLNETEVEPPVWRVRNEVRPLPARNETLH